MSAFIVVVVVGACTWVVFRAATQPVEPATAGPGATRAPAPRRTRPPKPRPVARPIPPVVRPPEPVVPAPVLPPVIDEVVDEVDEEVDEEVDDDEEEVAALARVAAPERRTGPRSDPGEPARPPSFLERARSGALLVGLAVVLGGALALAIGLGMLVLFNLLRGAVG